MKLAYFISKFPATDEAFILREIAEVGKKTDIVIFSLKKSRDRIVHERAKALLEKTITIPFFFSARLWKAQGFYLLRRPIRTFTTLAILIAKNVRNFDFLWKSLALFPKSVAMAKIVEEKGIDRLHAHWATHPTTAAWIVSRLTGRPMSFTAHAHDIYLNRTMLTYKMNQADFIVTCTEENKKNLVEFEGKGDRLRRCLAPFQNAKHIPLNGRGEGRQGKGDRLRRCLSPFPSNKIHVIYHGVEVKRYEGRETRDERRETIVPRPSSSVPRPSPLVPRPLSFIPRPSSIDHPPSQATLSILSVGTLNAAKGFDTLLDALAILKERNGKTMGAETAPLRFKARIIGSGPLETDLRRQMKMRDLEKAVTLKGYLPEEDLLPIYKEADLFILLPTLRLHWGIPNVLVEAMAAGLPVITTPLPSIKEIIRDGETGILVPERNPESAARALELLLRDEDLRREIGERGQQTVKEKFDLQINVNRFLQLMINTDLTQIHNADLTLI